MTKLSEHLDDWVTLLDEYTRELMNCPMQLRTKVLAIIPPDLETTLTAGSHPEVKSYQDIIRFCKARTDHARKNVLAGSRLKSRTGQVNTLAHCVVPFAMFPVLWRKSTTETPVEPAIEHHPRLCMM